MGKDRLSVVLIQLKANLSELENAKAILEKNDISLFPSNIDFKMNHIRDTIKLLESPK